MAGVARSPVPVGRCEACGRTRYTAAKTCRRRACPGYVDIWLGDNRIRLLENLLAFDGEVVMPTVTAPSLLWSSDCEGLGEHKHSGNLGCRVEAEAAREFNCTADKRHSRLHKAAAQRTYRRYGSYPKRLAYVPELQARGVIHWHVVLAWDTPLNRRLSRHYVRQLHELSQSCGLGFVDRKLSARPARIAAFYISKYLTKVEQGGLRELVVTQQAPVRAVYVHRALTAETRCTMRNLRLRRFIWIKWRVRLSCAESETTWELMKVLDADLVETSTAAPTSADP